MKVKVEAYASLREALGQREIEIDLPDKATFYSLIKKISNEVKKGFEDEIFERDGQIKPGVLVLINGKAVSNLEVASLQLNEGDRVILMPPVEGG